MTSNNKEVNAVISPNSESRIRRFARDFFDSKIATVGLFVLVLVILAALLAPWIAPQNPYDLATLDIMNSRMQPGEQSLDGQLTFLLGTDEQGRDLYSAILYGLRISILVGFVSTFIALTIGLLVGLIAGYVGGHVDSLIMRVADIQLSFPPILTALILLAVTGPGVSKIVIALVAVQWAYFARTARSAALVERRKPYTEAAVGLGLSPTRIILRHLLPNCLPPLIVVAAAALALAGRCAAAHRPFRWRQLYRFSGSACQ